MHFGIGILWYYIRMGVFGQILPFYTKIRECGKKCFYSSSFAVLRNELGELKLQKWSIFNFVIHELSRQITLQQNTE